MLTKTYALRVKKPGFSHPFDGVNSAIALNPVSGLRDLDRLIRDRIQQHLSQSEILHLVKGHCIHNVKFRPNPLQIVI